MYLFRVSIVSLFFLSSIAWVRGEVSATLSQTTAQVGEPVNLSISITDAKPSAPPTLPAISGLDIQYTGQSQQFRMENFHTSSSVAYNYTIVPLQAGDFTIPSIEVYADGAKQQTNPIRLTVGAGNALPSAPSTGTQNPEQTTNGKIAFAEILPAKTEAYVGEIIPVEVRLFFDPNIRWQLQQPVDLGNAGFVARGFKKPQEKTMERDGKNYQVIILQGAVTPTKTGQLAIGPATTKVIMQVPDNRRRPSSPFGDIFGNDPFFSFQRMQTRQVDITSDPITLTVKALPSKNVPANFSGAVGQFTSLTTEVPQRSGKVGDPFITRLILSGRSDFDRIEAPALEQSDGWRAYPPSSQFNQDDELGISGRQTWEYSLIPEKPEKAVPVFAFSYFDPIKETYQTLSSDPLSIDLTGGPLTPVVQATPDAKVSPAPSTAPKEEASQPIAQTDILYILEHPSEQSSFQPWYQRTEFYYVQAIGGLLAFGLIALAWVAKRSNDTTRNQKQLQKARTRQLRAALDASEKDASEFFYAAQRWIQHHFGEDIPKDQETEIRWLQTQGDAVRYSGKNAYPPSESDKQRVYTLIQTLEKHIS